MVDKLIEHNRAWSRRMQARDPEYFTRREQRQTPEYFWIGCADSRVPTNVVVGLEPGEVFVHRNVANVVHSTDLSLLSALEYAIEALDIEKIIVCGHYGCGGVKAATEEELHGLADHWLEPIRRLARNHADELDAFDEPEARRNRLAELNVINSVARVAATPILRRAWDQGRDVHVHGLIYSLHDGLLEKLECSVGPPGPPHLPPE
jgi:carbonic anhydrase